MKSRISVVSIAALIAFSAAPVMAADIRVPAPPVPLPLAYTWTGFYLGAHMGSAWTNSEWTTVGVPGTDASINAAGFIGGGQIGLNYQFASRWVIGIDGDFTGSTMNKSVNGCFTDPTQTCTIKNRWTALLTGRFGYAFDRSLFYVKGGAAWGNFNYENPDPVSAGETFSANKTRTGWTIGGGWEYAFTSNWSAKIEYNFLDFGNDNVTLIGPITSFAENINNDIHQVKLGVNYRFGAWY
jgi:outer membrane immunogenic protein